MGLLIVDGFLARKVSLGPRCGIEVLGPGDVTRPWVRGESSLEESTWAVIDSLSVARLDEAFAARAARWPQIAHNLTDRLVLRSQEVAFQIALCHLVTVEQRILVALWHFAERWGHVTADGTVLRFPVTHETLAGIVGSRRPPVSTALAELARKGIVRRAGEKHWRLAGPLPESPAELCRRLVDGIDGTGRPAPVS